MNSQEYTDLAHSVRRELINKLYSMIEAGRITAEEANLITKALEEVVYAERMNVHKMYDESFEEVRQ